MAALPDILEKGAIIGVCLSDDLYGMKTLLENGINPLHFVVRYGNLEMVKMTLESGIDPLIRDGAGLTVLEIQYDGHYEAGKVSFSERQEYVRSFLIGQEIKEPGCE